jgi:glycosyltransferase involved in cell wall biosynthesis
VSLLRAFRTVADRFPEWRLEIIGDGEERRMLADETGRLSLGDNVMLEGEMEDVRERLLSSSCLVLSSRFEGFGMALVEAMACGLPVVSYACPAGPGDIITDGVDGFLVPPGDEKALADRICTVIGDDGLRNRMGEAAFRSSARYDIDRIVSMWMDLFEGKC